jgi:PKD repeat protein
VKVRIKLRISSKIIFLGVALVILSSICSTFSCLTDTYAYFDDTRNVDVNLTAAMWDSEANLMELSDYKLPANNETLNGTSFIIRENPKSSETGDNSVDENSSNHGSSANDFLSDFSVAGNDTISLITNNSTLVDGNSRDSVDSSTYLEQPSTVLPAANFNSNITSGYAPLSVQFIDLSKNATKWNWDFEDGSASTEQNPIHIYSSSGTYTVNLTISNTNGTDSKLSSISVLEKPAVVLPIANFSSNVSSDFIPLSIKFTDLSENTTIWNWDFGDGNNSTEQNPVHTYSAPRNYVVTLAASNENGANSTFCTITVLQTALPIANFSSNIINGYAPLSVQFTDLSENATVWNWNFGDGNNSTEQNPVHTYSAAGNHTVRLIATNASCQSAKTREISVNKKLYNKRDFREQKTP